jgi:hypothetical protein
LVVVVVVVVLLLLLLRVRIPQVHLPHLRPVPLSAVVASAPEHTHTQIAHRTNPDRHCTPHVPARCSPLLTTDGAYRDGK